MEATLVETADELDETLQKLLDLQEINQNLDELSREIEVLREQTSLEERKYNTKKFQYNKNIPFLEKAKQEFDQIKSETDEINKKIEEHEERKKKIKTIKEFKAINREIDFLSQQNAIKENEILNKSEEVEFKQQKIDRIAESLKEIEGVFREKKEELEQLADGRRLAIKKQIEQKENLEKTIKPKLVEMFNRIYKNKASIAITPVVKNICQGCHSLTPKQIVINLINKDEINMCPFCSRIVYLGEDELDDS